MENNEKESEFLVEVGESLHLCRVQAWGVFYEDEDDFDEYPEGFYGTKEEAERAAERWAIAGNDVTSIREVGVYKEHGSKDSPTAPGYLIKKLDTPFAVVDLPNVKKQLVDRLKEQFTKEELEILGISEKFLGVE